MRIKEIDHVQLAMPSGREAEARAFYEGVLGIPEVSKPPNLAKRGGCWFVRDALKVHLGVENDFRPARKAHPALLVEVSLPSRGSLNLPGIPSRRTNLWRAMTESTLKTLSEIELNSWNHSQTDPLPKIHLT
jgi:catechol 2,3-dioxygenase-like lactoylglutathione lyase family enzyme